MIQEYINYIQEGSRDNITIEELPDSDINLLIPIFKRFAKSTNDTSFFNYIDQPFKERMKEITDIGHVILVAKDKNKIVGLFVAITRKPPRGLIKMVYIDEKYRGTGLAEKMFKQIVEWLKSKNRTLIRIGVMGKNKRARAFYKKMGFIEDYISMRNIDSKNIKHGW